MGGAGGGVDGGGCVVEQDRAREVRKTAPLGAQRVRVVQLFFPESGENIVTCDYFITAVPKPPCGPVKGLC